mmetsp:Transcript_67078/g.178937  ORF Transcript_67078/g.178937 Transcript_67078/m.178937 type:complete len:390 (+) Transcript_67078:46-1215(+)
MASGRRGSARPQWSGEVPDQGTLAVGPFGGSRTGGQKSFGFTPEPGKRLSAISVYWQPGGRTTLKGVSVKMADAEGGSVTEGSSPNLRPRSLCCSTVHLSAGEYIDFVQIHFGQFWNRRVVEALTLRTNNGSPITLGAPPQGGAEGFEVLDLRGKGAFVSGLHGFVGDFVDSLGVFLVKAETSDDGAINPVYHGDKMEWLNAQSDGASNAPSAGLDVGTPRGMGTFADCADKLQEALGKDLVDPASPGADAELRRASTGNLTPRLESDGGRGRFEICLTAVRRLANERRKSAAQSGESPALVDDDTASLQMKVVDLENRYRKAIQERDAEASRASTLAAQLESIGDAPQETVATLEAEIDELKKKLESEQSQNQSLREELEVMEAPIRD